MPNGLSGLTFDGRYLWTVPENQRALVQLRDPAQLYSIRGIEPDLELEGIAWMGDARVAVATESDTEGRESDKIYVLERHNGAFDAVSQLVFDYEHWGVQCPANVGLEAICATDSYLSVAAEVVFERASDRVAPLARYDFSARRWQPSELVLTSARGKISAMACRREGESLVYVGIERDFGITRVLTWTEPIATPSTQVRPRVVHDLSELNINLEGVAFLSARRIAIISDNQYHQHHDAPAQLLELDLQ